MTEQLTLMFRRVSQVALVVKKLPVNANEPSFPRRVERVLLLSTSQLISEPI